MDNNDETEGCLSSSLERNHCKESSTTKTDFTTNTLRPKYAGLKGFKKFQQEMARRKAANLGRELPISTNSSVGSSASVTFNDVPCTASGVSSSQKGSNGSDISTSIYKKANGDLSFDQVDSSPERFGSLPPTSFIPSKILEKANSGFINVDEESGESEEYECRCHIQQPNESQQAQIFTTSRVNQHQKQYQNTITFHKNVHYTIDMEKNGVHLPTDASSSQSEDVHHHLSVTFDVISHPPPPSSPLSPNIVANAICPPPPLTNEPVVVDPSIPLQVKYQSTTSSSLSQEVRGIKIIY